MLLHGAELCVSWRQKANSAFTAQVLEIPDYGRPPQHQANGKRERRVLPDVCLISNNNCYAYTSVRLGTYLVPVSFYCENMPA